MKNTTKTKISHLLYMADRKNTGRTPKTDTKS
jgi:hypothetical protein